MIELAHIITRKAFAEKVDKGGKPYVYHLQRVENLVRHLGTDIRCAALLHDLLEDCPEWTAERLLEHGFNADVVTAVVALTKIKGEPYDTYLQRVRGNQIARPIKIADLRDNMDVSRLSELTDKDVQRLRKYLSAYKFLSQ